MADEVNRQVECALDSLLSITEKSSNLRKDLKRDIIHSVSSLRSIFVVIKNSVEEHKGKITQLESEVKKMKVEVQECRAVTLTARVLPSVGGIGNPPDTSLRQGQPPTGGARNLL
jgi:predicted translin family RNA/ssDNA-binding protein